MNKKIKMKEKKTCTQQIEHVVSLSRRRLLVLSAGMIGGTLTFGGFKLMSPAKKKDLPISSADHERQQKEPFYSVHQAGILTPQQPAMMLVAFDILADNKVALINLFKILTKRIAFLTVGGPVPKLKNERFPPLNSGILGETIYPDNLTITVSVGASLFDDRFGLQTQKPRHLQKMTRFPNDALDATLCHGDLMLQICANTRDTVIHALRDIIKHMPALLSVRWKREGFLSPYATRSKGKKTPINLMGFKDGTANPDASDNDLMEKVIWVSNDGSEPAWAVAGSYQAVRLIRFYVEFWDRTPLQEQQAIFGRQKYSGAPLGMTHEHDKPDYKQDPDGAVMPLDAHIRLANPRTLETDSSLMLRRGYSYSRAVSNSGQLDMGLLFICYQADLEKSFITVQNRLNGEGLEEYVKPVGGGYYFALPGVVDTNHYLAQSLLEA